MAANEIRPEQQPKAPPPIASDQDMVWTNPKIWPDGTPRAPEEDDRPEPPHTQPVKIKGYSEPVHRHDRPVDIRDMETPMQNTRGTQIVGFGVGATIGSTAGAVVGSVLPVAGTAIGAAIGAAVGGIAGGLAGAGVAAYADPRDEREYWRKHHVLRPYFQPQFDYLKDYDPAYRLGYQARMQCRGCAFADVEAQLKDLWLAHRGHSRLSWDQAKPVMQDAWDRYDQVKSQTDIHPQSY